MILHFLTHSFDDINLAISMEPIVIAFAPVLRHRTLYFIIVRLMVGLRKIIIMARLLTIICKILRFHRHYCLFTHKLFLITCYLFVSLFNNNFGRTINTRAFLNILVLL